jgi:hypothetical protein
MKGWQKVSIVGVILMAGLILHSCVSISTYTGKIKLYKGPNLSKDKTAILILPLDSLVDVYYVDDYYIEDMKPEAGIREEVKVELLPGPHTISGVWRKTEYVMANYLYQQVARFETKFIARPGRVYTINWEAYYLKENETYLVRVYVKDITDEY